MLEDKLPQLIRMTYNIKILVASSYKAKQSLAAKGLTPSIFLDPFYSQKSPKGVEQVSYNLKERQIKPLPQFVPIDIDDYSLIRKEDKVSTDDIDEQILSKRLHEMLSEQKIKYLKDIKKEIFSDRADIEKFTNNQGFHWFQKANKMIFHALTMGQQNYRLNTLDWPMGICYIIQVEKDKTVKQIFDKLRNEVEYLLRKIFELSPDQAQSIKPLVIILYDSSQGSVVQQALEYSTYLKNFDIPSFLIYRLCINGEELNDQTMWSRFNRPILYTSYNIKGSDPIRISSKEQLGKVQEIVSLHKELIRKGFEGRLDELIKKYEQVNKTSYKFASFFKQTPNEKTYTKQELETRELADKLFLLQDYKRAYDIYKSITSKIQKRNINIQNSLNQMSVLCLALSKFHNLKLKSDPYGEIQSLTLNKILKYYQNRSKLRLKRFLIVLIYCFHTFRVFNRQFIRGIFYANVKQTFSQTNTNLNVISVLLYEQYANMNLLFKIIDYRRYCYDITRVASRFLQVKLHPYALRCFLIVQGLYKQTFAAIEKYQATQLSILFVDAKNARQALKNLKISWQIYIDRMESEDLQKNQQDLVKQIQAYNRCIKQVQKLAPNCLLQLSQPNLQIPVVHSLNLQTKDEMLDYDEKSGIKWQQIGDFVLDDKQILSIGLNRKQFWNNVRSFDYGVPEEKYLIYSFNPTFLNDAIIKKNSRNAYVGEPIRLTFYMRNPIRADIEVEQIQVKLKQNLQNVKIEAQVRSALIKSFKSTQFTFILTPMEPGFLQLQKIQWIFMKVLSFYAVKQPDQMKSIEKNCYFKLNVHPAVGCLQSKAFFQDYYYQGQKTKIKLTLKNTGKQQIQQIYVATAQPEVFGFTSKQLGIKIDPGQNTQIHIQIYIPLVHNTIQSGQQKRINKLLFIYKSKDKFRICRTINKFNIIRIAKIDNLVCQRLSMHLHLLSFSKKKAIHSKEDGNSGLEWMILPGGFDIVKKQAAHLANQTNYFFFIRRGNYPLAKFQFQNWVHDLSSYPEQFLHTKNQQNSLTIRFLWSKQHKMGYIQKTNIPITINQHGYLSSIFPISFKINFQKQLTNNFTKYPYYQIPIKIKLKNVLCNDELKITINFIQSIGSDSCWEGITQKRFNLLMGQQGIVNVKYVVVRPGIYVISNQIKYSIVNSKAQFVNMSHSDYQKLYLIVKNEEDQKGRIDFGDAFKQFESIQQQKTIQLKITEDLI